MANRTNNMLNINKEIIISLVCVSLIFSFFVFNLSKPDVSAETNNPPVANAGPDKETYETESIVLQGSGTDMDDDDLIYLWSCDGGSLSNPAIAQPLYHARAVPSDTNYTCTLTVTDPNGLSDSDSMNVLVRVHESPTLYVSLAANPNSGCAPLTNVDLSASVYGTATGVITYFFDCNNDGNWEKVIKKNDSEYIAYNLCDYNNPGNYTAKVMVERELLSAQATVSIDAQSSVPALSVEKTAHNLTDGGAWTTSVSAEPNDVISFSIVIKAKDAKIYDVIVEDDLPDRLIYQSGSLKVDGIVSAGDIFAELNIGDISADKKKTITYNVYVAGASNFNYGQTLLRNSVIVSSGNDDIIESDNANIMVNKIKPITAGVTGVPTGLTNNILLDSFFIPLLIALTLIWLFKSYVLDAQDWFELRKAKYQEFQAKKLLQLKVAKIKAKEFLGA